MRPNRVGGMLPRSGPLTSNKECRRAKENRIASRKDQQERVALLNEIKPFGIYRPLLVESYQEVASAALIAARDSGYYLQNARKLRNDHGPIVMNGDMGLTFMGYQAMRHGLEDAVKNNGLNPTELISDLDQIHTPEISIPISGFEWVGDGRRRLVGRFAIDSMAREELDYQRIQIDQCLDKHNVAKRPLEPDHVSLVRYGKRGDKQDLNSRHRREVANIFEETFQENNIGHFILGQMNIGTSYSRSLERNNDLNVIVSFSNEIED